MLRTKELNFDFGGDVEDPQPAIKNMKTCKTKFMKDLNYKNNTIIRSEKNNRLNENSKQREIIIKKQRTRKNTDTQMDSLLEKMIPGAKITKGEWKDHKLNGLVEIQYDNGNRFVGKYINGLRVEGKMTYTEKRCEYQGSFFAEKFSGSGKLSYEGGRVIEGEWDNMQFVGNATITYPNKDVYYGPVDEKLYKHGQGYLFLHDGYKYVGGFKHGSITGVGCYYKDDVLIQKGHWLKGKLVKQMENSEETEAMQGTNAQEIETSVEQIPDSDASVSMFSHQFKNSDEIKQTLSLQNSQSLSFESSKIMLSGKKKQNNALIM